MVNRVTQYIGRLILIIIIYKNRKIKKNNKNNKKINLGS